MKLRTPIFAPEDGGEGGNLFGAGGDKGGDDAAAKAAADAAAAKGGNGDKGGAFSFASALAEDGSFKPGWTDTLPEELKPMKETAGRYKTPVELIRGLHNANTLLGAKANAVIIPTEKSTPEEVAAFREKLGVPAKPEDYKVTKPDNLPAGVEWDEEKTKTYVETLHKHNATPSLVKELVAMRVAEQTAQLEAQKQGEAAFIQQGIATLKKEWGNDFDANFKKAEAVVNHYAERTGLKLDHVAFQFPEVIRFIAAIHKDHMGESKRIEGGGITGNDPATEARLIQTDSGHPMYKRYQEGEQTAVEHVRGLLARANAAK